MRVPKVKPRRRHGVADYMESDHDFMHNNRRACVWFLENRDLINKILKATTGNGSKF